MKDGHPIPIAPSGKPEDAYASHAHRMTYLAIGYADVTPLKGLGASPFADENNGVALIAHLHKLSESDEYRHGDRVPGSLPAHSDILAVIRSLRPQAGMGTSFNHFPIVRAGDYDMGIKCLMVIAYRYRHLLGDQEFQHILDILPAALRGGHDPSVDTIPIGPIHIDETENHRLMIHSCRYLTNQLLFDRGGDARFNNRTNGLANWLVDDYMATIARHDFLEFNARSYNRLSIHALLNLFEFAGDREVRTAAHILLDYLFMKFAVSSCRMQRVNPFRRLKEHTNTVASGNDLVRDGNGGDPMTGMFLAFSGRIGPDGKPLASFPYDWTFNALLAGLTPYRPPPAAYYVAMETVELRRPVQHRFYHGVRPALPAAGEVAEGGVEIYYRSPSFLMTAGGMFLNSGYGHDEIPIFNDYQQTAIAQATTLIPVKADATFADLIRFETYPDERRAVNTGVHLGFMCGANLRPAPRRTISDSSTHGPALAGSDTGAFLAWKGSGNEQLNLANVVTTSMLGLDGVEGVVGKRTYGDTSEANPAIAAGLGRVFLAWRGAGNTQLNIMIAKLDPELPIARDKKNVETQAILPEFSESAPALAFHAGAPMMAWTGGQNRLNLAKVALAGPPAGPFAGVGLVDKVTLGEFSEAAPALCSHGGRLAMAWQGGNDRLNVAFSSDGQTFGFKRTFGDTSELAPAIASHKGRLFLAWTGQGDGHLNVARIAMNGPQPLGLVDHVVLGDTSDFGPALASTGKELVLGWRGSGNEQLNLRSSADGRFQSPPPGLFCMNLDQIGIHLAICRTPVANADQLDTPIDSLGFVYAQESVNLPFPVFENRVKTLNAGLPAAFDYGGNYVFHAPHNRDFAFHLHPSLDKYTPRIQVVGDPNPAIDFRAMALVEGPWLSAPDGHEGAIEIRHPRFEDDPLVLDFRDRRNPVRADNFASCPDPWDGRAKAIAAYALGLTGLPDRWQRQRAWLEAIDLYFRLLEVDFARFSQPLVDVFTETMTGIGLDFTAPANSLGAWLLRPGQYSYPAIVEALTRLVDGRQLAKPVSLDAIVDRYEATPGVVLPAPRNAVDATVLAAALIAAHAERYAVAPVGNVSELMQ